MSRHYYQIVASLREYALDADVRDFDALVLRDTVAEELADDDRERLRAFYAFYDTANRIELHHGRTRLDPLGMLSREELEERLAEELKNPESEPEMTFEQRLWTDFYDACARSDNAFIRDWYAFDCRLRNIAAAWTARKTGRDPATVLVGGDDINRALATNPAVDFGLKGEVEMIEPLVRILENPNLLEKERALDRLRWETADELAEFHYFDLNRILAWCAKIDLVQRWRVLDPAAGNELFLRLIDELTAPPVVETGED